MTWFKPQFFLPLVAQGDRIWPVLPLPACGV